MGFHTRRVQQNAVGLKYTRCRLQFLRSERPWLLVYRGTVESGTGRDVIAVATTLRSLLIGLQRNIRCRLATPTTWQRNIRLRLPGRPLSASDCDLDEILSEAVGCILSSTAQFELYYMRRCPV